VSEPLQCHELSPGGTSAIASAAKSYNNQKQGSGCPFCSLPPNQQRLDI